jgi:hypothetical protein
VHAGPQPQASPHAHDSAGWATGVWQPQVHSEPEQTAHAQTFDWVDMKGSLSVC